ncbi:4a-hydroxytetrahydrobiopterin dehydratase [Aquipuribacter sp. MA13-6]|uniref:4a-hydroxytetrahydrobiopterin dehydratase n=1 Tax=unclassified Aquipuribacter TaxID=2635084 RepID=UPI003EEE5D0C
MPSTEPSPPPGPRRLTHSDVAAQLVDLPGWRHVDGALQARFDAPDVPAAVRLVTEAFDVAEEMDHHPDTDLRWKRVRFALSTHTARGVTQLDVELAHRLSRAADALGAATLPAAAQAVEIGVDTADPSRISPFWQAALGYHPHPEDSEVLVDPHGRGPDLWFQVTATPGAPAGQRNRLHLDVSVGSLEEAAERRTAVEAAGGRLVSDERAPAWWVYADADGNEVCVCTGFGRES